MRRRTGSQAVTPPRGPERRAPSGWLIVLLLLMLLCLADQGRSLEVGGGRGHHPRSRPVPFSERDQARARRTARQNHQDQRDPQTPPAFVQEPPSRVVYLNSTGASVHCQAYGQPPASIGWRPVALGSPLEGGGAMVLQMHGQGSIGDPLADVVGVRRLLPNGTLVLEPFSAQKARFHSGVFQCVASNEVGTIVSRDVHLRGGGHNVRAYTFCAERFLG